MNPSFRNKTARLRKTFNSRFLILTSLTFSISILLAGNYANAQSASEQVTLSEDLQNDPLAQDILKKIEQTKKMIEELQQKEFEQNQAQEHLEKMREMSIMRLNQDLEEWERLWEQHSSRNAFDSFVSKKPEYVQGVFWDQFEFKEQKVNAGRTAMNKVLANGGTIQAAQDAYNRAAATHRIELIEVNAQFNVKHNLADYEEQQIFNSTGQVHFSPLTTSKLSKFYSDYRLLPNYVLANPDDRSISVQRAAVDSDTVKCENGFVMVSRITSENKTCVDKATAENWISNSVPGIIIYDGTMGNVLSDVKTNPATDCGLGNHVIYHIAKSEYQCVSESKAKEMVDDNTAAIHTLVEYILNKDKQKIEADKIYEINQEILIINDTYEADKKALELHYQTVLGDKETLMKQKIREAIKKYKDDTSFTKDDLSKTILAINEESNSLKKTIGAELEDALSKLELELKRKLLETVKEYEGNLDIDVDWQYLGVRANHSETEQETTTTALPKPDETNNDEIHIANVEIVNTLGQKLHDIAPGQALQVVADITNPNDLTQRFVYMLDIKDNRNNSIQPTQWITGTINADQTFNVGLSWIPQESGEFIATVYSGMNMDTVSPITNIEIIVN